MNFLKNILLILTLIFLLFPILIFQSQFVVLNYILDLPILVIMNVFLLVLFLEIDVNKFKYKSIYLLVVASVAVFSSFFRIIPLPTGITLAFVLPIVSGVVFGSSFGFIIGQLSMLVGGIFLGAFGPWLPYQTFLMGCVGYYAGFLFYSEKKNKFQNLLIIIYAVAVSFLYGFWMSIDTWQLAVNHLQVSDSWVDRLKMYGKFYLISSLFWDFTRAIGNVFVFSVFLKPTCELLKRAKSRLINYQ